MKKYKVGIREENFFVVDVLAKDETEAQEKAHAKWYDEIVRTGTEYMYQNRDTEMTIDTVCDVTNTDDPFNP